MMSANSTPSSDQKPKRNYLEEFLPLYKKFGESNAELKKCSKSSEKHYVSSSKVPFESPKHQPKKHQEKQAVDISQIIIDGKNLNYSGGNSTPLHEYKTFTPVASKKSAKSDKKLKKNTSAVEQSTTEEDSVSVSSKSHKRSKSVSFLLEEKDQAIAKKIKSDGSQDGAAGDKQKEKKHKKNKKLEKENKADDGQNNVDETTNDPSVVTDRKLKKQGKWKKQEKSKVAKQVVEKSKKAKKQKHQEKNEEDEGEPTSKSPKTEFIDNLGNLNLGENTHTLSHLIDEMTVVDKANQKKLRKEANREKNHATEIKQVQNVTDKNENVTDKNENVTDTNEEQTVKKKWGAKRWNKRQVAEKDQKTTINVDNLPASLLRGNFKKVLIDHFAKYGLSRSVGEPIIQNEEDQYPVFTTKMYFNCAEAAQEAQEMDGTVIAGNEIRVSPMRPLTETVLVVRIYGHPSKLSDKDIKTAFGEVGLIRSIRPMLRKKKTMATAFIEFEDPDAVGRALQKCANLTINGKKVMASPFQVKNNGKSKKKRGGKSKHAKNKAAGKDEDDDNSDSGDSDDE